jgi:dienelactone hydrolase
LRFASTTPRGRGSNRHIGFSCFAQAAEIEERGAVIISDGARLAAELYYPKAASQALPTIIMSHGWGGTAAMLRPQAMDFAKAGYFVIVFDYRGWGKSQARVIQTGPAAAEKGIDGRFAGEMRELRELVDPLDQAMDIQNVIHWAMGEGAVDKNRLGLWGTSFSGGLVVYVAARDPRVRALVSQVGYMGQPVDSAPAGVLEKNYGDATRRARGELGYPPPGMREVGNLTGAPLREKFLLYAPVDDAAKVKNCAMLFIAAEREELFDNRLHPQLAYERAVDPKKYVVIPSIAHYGIYGEAREQATRLAIDWFDQHLKK